MIEANNIHKVYDQEAASLHVLKGVSLKISEGDFLAIVGPSGAGKSTLLHIIGGLDKPSRGNVIFDKQDLYQMTDRECAGIRNQKIGFVFQFYHLLSEFTALENVVMPALIKSDMAGKDMLFARGLTLLEKVGLKARSAHKPNQLSGGEQQRVAIARALINDPKVIFCDEPTGNLDSKSGQGIIELLVGLNKSNRQTLVIVTHDEHIAQISHSVVHIADGKFINPFA